MASFNFARSRELVRPASIGAGEETASRPCARFRAFTAGADVAVDHGSLRILRDGAVPKFVEEVAHLTFNGERASAAGQSVLYITERCVLRLGDGGLELIEIAPGVSLERDVLARMGFRPRISPDLREMIPGIFTDAPLGLSERSPLTLDERFHHRPDDNVVFINFEGLTLDRPEDARGTRWPPRAALARASPAREPHRQLRQLPTRACSNVAVLPDGPRARTALFPVLHALLD